MIQGYVITLVCECHPRLVYHGIVYGDGVTWESRVDDELSGRKRVNQRFAELLEAHERYAFEVEKTGDFGSLYEAIMDEAERIKRDDSTHPDKGFNVEKIDKKRLARAQAEYVPSADIESLLDAAIADFRNSYAAEWTAFDCDRNEAALRATAKRLKCSIHTAFSECLTSGEIAVATA